jgi:putative ABC transport system permease protein
MIIKRFSLIFRHILRFKEYSLLNVAGLAIGMASAMIIIIWANAELNTNKFHKNGKNIYQLHKQMKWSDGHYSVDISTTGLIGPAIVEEIPEVKAAVRIPWNDRVLFRVGDKSLFEDGIFADSVFFQVFSFDLIHGDPQNVLKSINSVVISEKLSKKYFANENPIGKTIKIRYDTFDDVYTVTGVFKDVPGLSSMKFEFVLPFGVCLRYYNRNYNWGNNNLMTFILTKPGVDTKVLDKKITELLYKHASWQKNFSTKIFTQPYEDTYLYGNYGESSVNPSGLIRYVQIFLWVAVFIIFLASMNYTNMATALAIKRAREVGVKKAFGSNRAKLLGQFLLESISLTFAAFFISILLVKLSLPYFNLFVGRNIPFDFSNYEMLLWLLIVPVITGIMSGAFPAIYLSSLNPIKALRKANTPKKGQVQLRHVLVVVQFVITIAFIIASFVVLKQLKYMQTKNLGLAKENILYFNQSTQIQKHRQVFKDELLRQDGITGVTYTNMSPFNINSDTSDPAWRGKDQSENYTISNITVDHDFFNFFDADIIAGRSFSTNYMTDTNCIVINERFAKIMKIENPVGEVVRFWGRTATVIGIVKDFHIGSFQQPISQTMILCRPSDTEMVMVKIEKNKTKIALKNIENVFRKYEENMPFEYEFLDKSFEQNFKMEKYLGRISNLFAFLAIIISCLGLFGLALFTAEQRTKEIGIRKSIGATTGQVMFVLALEFVKWIAISFIMASAIAWFVLSSWLNNYAYKTELSWWIFALTGLITLAIALITVSWQSYKAATRNPVESLRYE